MKNLHPLKLRAGSSNNYLFLFSSNDGNREFSFPMNYDQSTKNWSLDSAGIQYGDLTAGDAAGWLISKCICEFNMARQHPSEKYGTPLSIEYLGVAQGNDFIYSVNFEGSKESKQSNSVIFQVERNYDLSTYLIKSELGTFDSAMGIHGYMILKDRISEYRDLMQSILHFDGARDYPLYSDLPVFRVDMRFEGVI